MREPCLFVHMNLPRTDLGKCVAYVRMAIIKKINHNHNYLIVKYVMYSLLKIDKLFVSHYLQNGNKRFICLILASISFWM